MKLIGYFIVHTAALLVTAYVIPGFVISDFKSALVAVAVIGVINVFVKPILTLITLPITFLTLGLFALVLNVVLLMLAAYVTPGFEIDGFVTALIGSLVMSLTASFLNMLAK